MAHFKTMDQTKVTDLTRITIGNAKFYQTLILENSTFIKHNTDSIMITYVTIYFKSYAICVPVISILLYILCISTLPQILKSSETKPTLTKV